MPEIDHIVFATADLAAGTAWLTERLGCRPEGGGRHPVFGTHNALWPLGEVYLELIAVDPDAPPPDRARLFALDDPAMRRRIARQPVLVHWVLRTGDADKARARLRYDPGPPVAMSRGALRWRLTVREDGSMAAGGLLPSLVEWPEEATRPPETLPDRGLRLGMLMVTGPAAEIARVPRQPVVHTAEGSPGLAAEIDSVGGSPVRFAAQA